MRSLFRFVIVCAALAVAVPAHSELYKWVDQNGITNYSNKLPEGPSAVRAVGVENRLSVYSPDPAFLQTVKAMRDLTIRALSMPAPPEPPYAVGPTQPLTAYEQCLQSGRVGCEDLYGQYYLPWYAAAYPWWYGPGYFSRRMVPFSRVPANNRLQSVPRREAIPRSAHGGPISRGGHR